MLTSHRYCEKSRAWPKRQRNAVFSCSEHAPIPSTALSPFDARASDSFTVVSTAGRFLAARLRNSAKRCANRKWLKHATHLPYNVLIAMIYSSPMSTRLALAYGLLICSLAFAQEES